VLTSLEIRNFRGFRDLTIPKIARVNLITGKNNTGKTALLEAIYWLVGRDQSTVQNLPGALRPSSRQDQMENFWRWLFFGKDARNELLIKGAQDNGEYLIIKGSLKAPGYQASSDTKPQPLVHGNAFAFWRQTESVGPGAATAQDGNQVSLFSTRPTTPEDDAKAFSEVILTPGGEERVESLLREIEPRLRKVRPVQRQNMSAPLMYADVGLPELIPTTQLGEGFSRLMSIFAALVPSRSRVCLIDEIENGLHHTILCDVWRGLAAVARQQNVQVFATTHSWECVVAAHEVFSKESEYDFALHRLERSNEGDVKAVTLEKDALEVADRAEWEVR
jgi:AAA15 family ATPase/GTPase